MSEGAEYHPINHGPPITIPEPPARPTWAGAVIKDQSLWFKCGYGPLKVKLNPVVTIMSVAIIVAFILWCVLESARKFLYIFFNCSLILENSAEEKHISIYIYFKVDLFIVVYIGTV